MNRLRWWVIPGAMIVLARVVTLDARGHDGIAAADDLAAPSRVVAQDASGSRAVLPLGELASQALVIGVPAELAGERVTLTLWRRLDGVRESKAWIDAEPRVRSDATLKLAGIAPGDYDVKIVAGERTFTRDGVTAPGSLTFAANAAPNR